MVTTTKPEINSQIISQMSPLETWTHDVSEEHVLKHGICKLTQRSPQWKDLVAMHKTKTISASIVQRKQLKPYLFHLISFRPKLL